MKTAFRTSALALLLVAGIAPSAMAAMVGGDVQKVDATTGKVTLKHGPIPDLDMGDMTMVYTAKDPAILKGIKAGDKVRFEPAEVGGKYTITRIEKAK